MLDGALIEALIENKTEVKIYLICPFGHISAKDAREGIVSEIIGFDRFFLEISYERKTAAGDDEIKHAFIPVGNILGMVYN